MQPATENLSIAKLAMRKRNEPTKYPREKIPNPRNAHQQKFRTHETTTRKNFGPTTYPREKISDPQNNHEKKF